MFDRFKGLGVILLVSCVVECGGNSDGAVTSLPPMTKLMTLTAAQKTQLCNGILSYDAKNVSTADTCKLQGIATALFVLGSDSTLTDADLQSACSQTVTACNAAPIEAGTCPIADTSTCSADATIADVSMCIADDATAVNAAIAAYPACSMVTKAWLQANSTTINGGPAVPASCSALIAKCPNIMAAQ